MKRLKELRLQKGLTQQQVANAIGKTYQAYSYYENGKRDPDTETLKLLADFFNVSTDYLLEAPQNVENKKIPKDLKKILEEEEVTLNGRMVSEEEKEQMLRIVEALYSDAKEKIISKYASFKLFKRCCNLLKFVVF